MCAGFAQVTLVELRTSYEQGCKSNKNRNQRTQTKQPTNPNKTKQKTARATFKVTHKALKGMGETGAMNSALRSEVLVHQRMQKGCMDRCTRSVESGNVHKATGITVPPKAL